ncbi:DivIVA domain-containing protein [Leucobacter ruminantium]|uniref:Cell wall synthesis protein Wag31 n=1 Tax=Leucobacter ruminantium TaxID=1289170 RepID=A0A939M340_9MICO|nr:DivIVA domain-containing protein [Leucobacter ruminantium]MBO1806100.1 DivIVA domain-containing protein [Leucobacter ruminantium]
MAQGVQQEAKRGGQNGVVHTAFPLAGKSELGYHPEQVDAFLERARSSYETASGEGSGMTAAEVRGTAFAVRKRGYSARYVDAAMDRLEEVFFERERRARLREIGEDAWWDETRQLLSEVRGRLQRPRGRRFRRRGLFATGYRRSQVDAFLDRVSDMFERREIAIAPADVRDVVFHSQWRGYDEDQVDALLDSVVDLILSTR